MRWAGVAAIAGAVAAQAQTGTPTDSEIVITADRPNSFGADYVQAGSFRGARQIDTPLTVTVLPETLLRAQQADGLADALRNSAGVVASQVTPSVYANLTIRGITVENRGNYRLNGTLPIINLIDLPLENKFRVEALKGASSLYYGFTTPGGIINLTSKRPTQDFAFSARMAGNQYGQAVASADVSDTRGPLGARLIGAIGTQENGIHRVDGVRYLGSGAFDLKPADGLTIALDSEYIFKSISEPTQISLNTTNTVANGNSAYVIPRLLDPSTNLGDTWLKSKSEETNVLLHARYEIVDGVSISGDVGQSRLTRDRHYSIFTNYNLVTGNGAVQVTQSNRLFYRNRMDRAEFAAAFAAGPISHSLIIGYSRNVRIAQAPVTANNAATQNRGTLTFAQNLYNPVRLPKAELPPRVVNTFTGIDDIGYYAFDTIKIGEAFQLLGGVRKADYAESNKLTDVQTFAATPTTLSGSAVVKPNRWSSVYASYIEGLETTALAPASAANAFAQLPASPSKQYEAGVKLEPISHFLLTAAYFRIDRTSASVNPTNNIYEFIGKARFQGVELSASGEITPDLSLYLTALKLKARQLQSATASLVGKRIENTPKTTFSAFAEYRLPFAAGFAISGGAYFIGNRAVNALNAAFIPGYTTYDLGGSYTIDVGGAKVVFRVNGENITGKRYYAATGSSLLGQGLPSVIKFSVDTSF